MHKSKYGTHGNINKDSGRAKPFPHQKKMEGTMRPEKNVHGSMKPPHKIQGSMKRGK